MVASSFTIELLNLAEVHTFFVKLEGALQDQQYAWPEVAREFWQIQEEQFNSEGKGNWQPLSPNYAKWKAAHFPGRPILQLTQALKNKATKGTERKFADKLYLGWTGVDYWRYHQTGTIKMPARPVIDLDAADRNRILTVWIKQVIQRIKST